MLPEACQAGVLRREGTRYLGLAIKTRTAAAEPAGGQTGPPRPSGSSGQAPIAPARGTTTAGGQTPGFGQGGQPGQGGICGVQSKSKAASIKIYNGQQEYDLWQFDMLTAGAQFRRMSSNLEVLRLRAGHASQRTRRRPAARQSRRPEFSAHVPVRVGFLERAVAFRLAPVGPGSRAA